MDNIHIFFIHAGSRPEAPRILEAEALDSLDEVSSGEMEDFNRASGNVSDLWDQVGEHL